MTKLQWFLVIFGALIVARLLVLAVVVIVALLASR